MNDLAQFTGTEAYHAFTPFYKDVLTDGTKYFAESRQCFWLFDAITSHINEDSFQGHDFLTIKIRAADNDFTLTIEDGNGKELARQTGWTDLEADQMFFAAPYDYYENARSSSSTRLSSVLHKPLCGSSYRVVTTPARSSRDSVLNLSSRV